MSEVRLTAQGMVTEVERGQFTISFHEYKISCNLRDNLSQTECKYGDWVEVEGVLWNKPYISLTSDFTLRKREGRSDMDAMIVIPILVDKYEVIRVS